LITGESLNTPTNAAGTPRSLARHAAAETTEPCAARERDERVHRYREAVRVRETLHTILRAAGITGLAALIGDDNPLDTITLSLPAEGGRVVAGLLWQALAWEFRVADALRAATLSYGVDVGVRVVDRRIRLGAVSVPGADLMAVLLGASEKYTDLASFDDHAVAMDVGARLEEAVNVATGASFDVPFCLSGFGTRTRPVIELGSLDPMAARKLAHVLNPVVVW
jgi:hypothetical protein